MDQKKAAMYAAICGAIVFIGVLLPWYSVSASGPMSESARVGISGSANGTQGDFMGTFTLIFGLIGGGAAALIWKGAKGLPMSPKQLSLVALGMLGLGALFTLIDVVSHGKGVDIGLGLSAGKSFGIYLTLLAALAGTYCGWVLYQTTPGSGSTPPGAPPSA